MNKKKVEALLPKALEALNDENCHIQERDADKNFTGKIKRTFRGHISSFGAAVTMGSFKAAVAFFSKQEGASVDRAELLRAMYFVSYGTWKTASEVMQEVIEIGDTAKLMEYKENFLNASVAIKLAMNAFDLIK